jgi:hypothetical protein
MGSEHEQAQETRRARGSRQDPRGSARSIRGIDAELAAQAGRAVNVSLTLRNWLIGYHIAVYELSGADRARYGAHSSYGGGPTVLGTRVRKGP